MFLVLIKNNWWIYVINKKQIKIFICILNYLNSFLIRFIKSLAEFWLMYLRWFLTISSARVLSFSNLFIFSIISSLVLHVKLMLWFAKKLVLYVSIPGIGNMWSSGLPIVAISVDDNPPGFDNTISDEYIKSLILLV